MNATDTLGDLRFEIPIYTLTDASRHLVVPRSTLETWANGYVRWPKARPAVKGDPIITAVPQRQRGGAQLPFIGVVEAFVLNAFRRAGVPMQRIRPSVDWLVRNVGFHALASKDLYTDGAEVLWDFAQRAGEGSPDEQVVKHLIVPRSGQYVFKDIVQHYLRQISFDEDKLASSIRLPQCGDANVVLDPVPGFWSASVRRQRRQGADALGPLRAGEPFEAVALDYGISDSDCVTPSTPSPPEDSNSSLELPHVFVDRSLGALRLPAILRSNGIALTTMREHCREAIGQRVADTAGFRAAAAADGPFIYSVHPKRIERLL